MAYIAKRLKERSTWLGIVTLIATLGYSSVKEYADVIVELGLVVGSVIAVFTKD